MAAEIKVNSDDGKTTYVAKDMIWKDYCKKADITAKNWDDNWGFMLEDSKPKKVPSTRKESQLEFPATASGMVGWRSTNPACKLEKYGKYARGKMTMTKKLGWPAEGVI